MGRRDLGIFYPTIAIGYILEQRRASKPVVQPRPLNTQTPRFRITRNMRRRRPWITVIMASGRMSAVRETGVIHASGTTKAAVVFDKVSLAFDDNVVLRDISFTIRSGSLTFLLGASGSGKSVVLKLILGLLKPDSGAILVKGERIDTMREQELLRVRGDMGMLFQETALFDSLTVAENVGYKLYEETEMPADQVRRRVEEVLGFIGLEQFIDRMPSELSGGQRRRVAIGRAVAARPRLVLFDDPTSGLDPITAKTIDAEIIKLRDVERVTSVVVTHQLPDAFYIATHQAVGQNGRLAIEPDGGRKDEEALFIVLKDGRIHFDGNTVELRASHDPYLKTILSGWVPPVV